MKTNPESKSIMKFRRKPTPPTQINKEVHCKYEIYNGNFSMYIIYFRFTMNFITDLGSGLICIVNFISRFGFVIGSHSEIIIDLNSGLVFISKFIIDHDFSVIQFQSSFLKF